MSRQQLDILALEPFHGGARRSMLEAISRCSRHRWTILKLPPRKMERRLLLSALWFAEHISRNTIGKVDLVFCSEALNLAEFFRLQPALGRKPSVVYFHDNQLPDPDVEHVETPVDLVNLNSASAATEIWFNSMFNLRTFLSRASGMVARHPELRMRNPMPGLTGKSTLIPPPIDLESMREQFAQAPATRDPRSVLLDTRGADPAVLHAALTTLQRRKERLRLTMIGNVKGLPALLRPVILSERDDAGHLKALLASNVFVAARPNAASDELAVRAMALNCQLVVTASGVYADLVPDAMRDRFLHDGSADSIVERILDAWYLEPPVGMEFIVEDALAPFEAIAACKLIDDRLSHLADLRLSLHASPSVRSRQTVSS